MERINCVRMYLGVHYISEICNTSGDGFVVGIMTGTTRNLEYKTTTTKPYQKNRIQEAGPYSAVYWKHY